ncbi:MAG: nickel pincer cofactor biosynthesis protein LarB [Candidatus Sumerlaeota bacterium]
MNSLQDILGKLSRGEITSSEAEALIRDSQIADLGFAVVDLQRQARRGRPEVIFCERKTIEHVVSIARAMLEAKQGVLLTRLTPEQTAAIRSEFSQTPLMENINARIAFLGNQAPKKNGVIGVLAAGTSDLSVAEEASFTAEALGSTVQRAYDVGVAGLHRLLARRDLLTAARVLIVVAGMEGALPSVVSGLTAAPVIAVPTSVGYGAHMEGISAFLSMINSCSPGVSVMNIDNGFGAGYLADVINGIGENAGAGNFSVE